MGQDRPAPPRRPPAASGPHRPRRPWPRRCPTRPRWTRCSTAWAQQNGKLKSLTVSFVRIDKSKVWGDKTEYVGNAYLQSPTSPASTSRRSTGPGQARRSRPTTSGSSAPGQEVRQYDFKTQQIFVFPLDRDQRKRAIQEGPLPFLFNLNAQEAKLRWSHDADGRGQGQLPDRHHAPADRRTRRSSARRFSSSARRRSSPTGCCWCDTNGKDTQDYKFTQVEPNRPINPVFFQALNIKGWKVVVNPDARRGPRRPGRAAAAAGRAGPRCGAEAGGVRAGVRPVIPRRIRPRRGRAGPAVHVAPGRPAAHAPAV